MLADPTTCTAGLKAALSLGFTKPLYGVASCGTTDFSKNAATYTGGVTLTQGNVSPTGDDADAKIFTQAMDKNGKKTEDLFHAVDGFQTVINVYTALKTVPAPATTESLSKALSTNKTHAFMLGPDAHFTCDGKALRASRGLPGMFAPGNQEFAFIRREYEATSLTWSTHLSWASGSASAVCLRLSRRVVSSR